MIEAALNYVSLGFAVFPCREHEKTPAIPNGFHGASTDPEIIRAWWAQFPNANIGIACGASGLVVVDVDPPNGGIESLEALRDLVGSAPFETVTGLTGGGGQHYVYSALPGQSVRNSAGLLGSGIDVRAEGGYIIAPPSIHPNGRTYQWEIGYELGEFTPLPFPVALRQRLQDVSRTGNAPEIAHGARIPEGKRNPTLASMAGTMRRRGLEYDEIFPAISAVNAKRCVPPLSDDEVSGIVKSVCRYPHSEPAYAAAGSMSRDDAAIASLLKHCTDAGNADWFAHVYGEDARYVPQMQSWIFYNGERWVPDDKGLATRCAIAGTRKMHDIAQTLPDDARTKLIRHALQSESVGRVEAALRLAQSLLSIPITELDSDPWLVGCDNGVLDLRTGELLEPQREYYITKTTRVPYIADAQCPTWSRFLTHSMDGDQSQIEFIQRYFGSSMAGVQRDHAFAIFHGGGANGKTTCTETWRRALGDYATSTSTDTFLASKNDGPRNDLARLVGARLVTATETDETRRLDEATIKSLCGGDEITCRFLHKEFFSFTPGFKIVMSTNHMPRIRGTDRGLWRRVRLVPWSVTVPPSQQDPRLQEKLREELPGILNWGLAGCLAWQNGGLREPESVRKATAAYRVAEDTIRLFTDECCSTDPAATVAASDLYTAYKRWSEANGETALSKQMFGRRLADRGLVQKKVGKNNTRYWSGLALGTEIAA